MIFHERWVFQHLHLISSDYPIISYFPIMAKANLHDIARPGGHRLSWELLSEESILQQDLRFPTPVTFLDQEKRLENNICIYIYILYVYIIDICIYVYVYIYIYIYIYIYTYLCVWKFQLVRGLASSDHMSFPVSFSCDLLPQRAAPQCTSRRWGQVAPADLGKIIGGMVYPVYYGINHWVNHLFLWDVGF